jgi:mannose-1-phosphate guanylyltransferase
MRAVVLMAGGAGTRLAPLSTEEKPKQFLEIFDGRSLLQLTFERALTITSPSSIFVSTNDRYVAHCTAQLPELPAANILAEPARRNTGPAVALCTVTIEQRLGPCTVAFLPSDHHIGRPDEFSRVLRLAFDHAETHDDLVTVGIKAVEPHTGFGYLHLGESLGGEMLRVHAFVEKPDRLRAEEYVRSGEYAWNAGMFVWRTSVFRRELSRVSPEIAGVTYENYQSMTSISIDHALMENASSVAAIRGDFDWSDVGSWEALRRIVPGV